MLSKKENLKFLKTYQKELLNSYEAFFELIPSDFVQPKVPLKKELERKILNYAAHLDRLAKDVKFVSRANRLSKFAEMLSSNLDFRSKRVQILLTRKKNIIEFRKARHNAKIERVARLADEYGFTGSLFRDLLSIDNPLSLQQAKRLEKKTNMLSQIIAKMEKPTDRSLIPDNTELLTISQVARMLGWGESVVRERNKKGLLPLPVKNGGTIQWRRQELLQWLEAHCPTRQKWEQIKQRKGA